MSHAAAQQKRKVRVGKKTHGTPTLRKWKSHDFHWSFLLGNRVIFICIFFSLGLQKDHPAATRAFACFFCRRAMTVRLSDSDRDPKRVKLFGYLPADCWRIIFSVLVDVQSFGRLACVCRETRAIATTAASDALRARLRGAEELAETGDGWGYARFSRLPNRRLDGRYSFLHENICGDEDRDETRVTAEYRNGRRHGKYKCVDASTYRKITKYKCEFKDGLPWSGQLHSRCYHGYTTTTYTDGQPTHDHVVLAKVEMRRRKVVAITWRHEHLADGERYTARNQAFAELHIKAVSCRTPPDPDDLFDPTHSDHRFALCSADRVVSKDWSWGVLVAELVWRICTPTENTKVVK